MIPSLLQIPSAVSDSKLHSVLPNNGKGDFQFDRSTGATRINKDGLIEEVGYFSSELVQNGNFSELGSELVTNGDFESNIDNWAAKDCTIVWDNGKLKCDNSSGNSNGGARQNVGLQNSKTYKLVATIQILSAGSNGTFNLFTSTAAGTGQSGVYTGSTLVAGGDAVTETAYFTTGTDGDVSIQFSVGVSNAIYTIDNVSVKQVDPNDRWTLGTGYTYGNGVVNSSSSDGNFLTSSATLVVGKTYKVSFDVTKTSGELRHYNGGFTGITANATGTFSGVFTPTETILRFYSSAFVGSVDNVSVVEVQGDRPRLSYDITNGVVEDKPHLLLEPSRTNLITFSEDFNNGWSVNQTTRVANAGVCPDGTNNAFNLIANAASGVHLISATASTTNQRTMSIFAKQNGYTRFRFNTGSSGNGFASFNLSNGTVAATGGTFFNNAKIESLPNDWYRCSMTMNSGGGTTVTIAMEDDARKCYIYRGWHKWYIVMGWNVRGASFISIINSFIVHTYGRNNYHKSC